MVHLSHLQFTINQSSFNIDFLYPHKLNLNLSDILYMMTLNPCMKHTT